MDLTHANMKRLQQRAGRAEDQARELSARLEARRVTCRNLGLKLAAAHDQIPEIREEGRRAGVDEAQATFGALHQQLADLQEELAQEQAERSSLEAHLDVQADRLRQTELVLAHVEAERWEAAAQAGAEIAGLRRQLAEIEARHIDALEAADPRNLRARIERERAGRVDAERQLKRLRDEQLTMVAKSRRERAFDAAATAIRQTASAVGR
jgi:chromosome segregation ATPase